jgi:hypothetical protein
MTSVTTRRRPRLLAAATPAVEGGYLNVDQLTRGHPCEPLHIGLRVTDLERSLELYAALGHQVVGDVPTPTA